jgi:hypothetical protein
MNSILSILFILSKCFFIYFIRWKGEKGRVKNKSILS